MMPAPAPATPPSWPEPIVMSNPNPCSGHSASFLRQTLVLIPALNEEQSIVATIARWRALGVGWVRVVDNGSNDLTVRRARDAGAEVMHEARRGYGAACWQGLQNLPSTATWILFSSADGSDRLEECDLGPWKQAAEAGTDLVMGNRLGNDASRRHLKLIQCFGNWLCCSLIRLLWGRRFRDMSSLRLVRRSALEKMQLQDRGFGWNIEMQVRAVELKLPIVELPVRYHARMAGQSKISGTVGGTCRAAWGMLRTILKLWLPMPSRRRSRL